jgi:hypothetical protein
VEVSTEEMTVAVILLAPVVVLGLVGMVRGYHLHLRIWKPGKYRHEEDEHGND